jgi:hypothetical protein
MTKEDKDFLLKLYPGRYDILNGFEQMEIFSDDLNIGKEEILDTVIDTPLTKKELENLLEELSKRK